MTYQVLIRRNSDGVERLRTVEWDWFKNGEHGDLYWWTEGNFGCDCNRKWEFERAYGEPISEQGPCGRAAYTVVKAILPNGLEIPIDGASIEGPF